MRPLTLLHTSSVHIETFNTLLAELNPDLPVQHFVDEILLQEARDAAGMTPALVQRVQQTVLDAAGDGQVVLCTCSTIGDWAEQVSLISDKTVIRVDRPMAEQAVALGSRIIVVATLASTLTPTRELIQRVAQQAHKQVEIVEALCEAAWTKFEAGDQAGYIQEIAKVLLQMASQGDVIVLAQASMAPAAELCQDLPIPILSSPRLGLEAALQAYSLIK